MWMALLGSSIFAIANGAQVRMAAPIASPATPDISTTSPQASARDRAAGAEGEIIVTAQRRSESLRGVPIAITVVNGDSLRETGAVQLSGFCNEFHDFQAEVFDSIAAGGLGAFRTGNAGGLETRGRSPHVRT